MSGHSVSMSPAAVGKVVLHCHKHPSKAVTGLLVGKTVDGVLYVDDVMPLFHTYTQLLPMVEVGMEHAKEWAKGNGLEVVGCYAAPATTTDKMSPNRFTESLMGQITKSRSGACIAVQVMNSGVKADVSELPFKFYSGNDLKAGRTAESGICKIQYLCDGALAELGDAQAPFERLRLAITEEKAGALSDFEDYLEEPSADWTCADLGKYLTVNVAPVK